NFPEKAQQTFAAIRDHVLLPAASDIQAADERLSGMLSESLIREVVDLVPEVWLSDPAYAGGSTEQREAFVRFLVDRLNGNRAFVQEAINARSALL
ncbi:MAG: aminotransferase class I and II, partial [Actinomycetota bacterium]